MDRGGCLAATETEGGVSRGISQRTRDAADHIASVLADEGPRTKRGCAYESLGVVISSMDEVDFIERAVAWGIENLVIDPELILEVGRREEAYPVFESRGDVKRQLDLWCYGTYWPQQPTRVLVWYEKAALGSIIKPACDGYLVPSLACRGDNSDTQLRLLLKRIYSDPIGPT
jgi:hypothetical protein